MGYWSSVVALLGSGGKRVLVIRKHLLCFSLLMPLRFVTAAKGARVLGVFFSSLL